MLYVLLDDFIVSINAEIEWKSQSLGVQRTVRESAGKRCHLFSLTGLTGITAADPQSSLSVCF